MKRWIQICVAVVAFTACGDKGGGETIDGPPGGGDGPGPGVDADNHPDGVLPQGCAPGTPPGDTQCTDCVDNDMDGDVDGFDVECTGAADDDESSFETGIPGDNIDPAIQDCFFDGNSGAGDDGCAFHTCCILGAPDVASCPVDQGPPYDPSECDDTLTQECIDNCAPLTPPGCDCFGCCTVCDPATNVCRDIVTNPIIAPDCDADSILDPVACPSCVKNDQCGTPCDPANCILCPGQDPGDLPPECGGTNECPVGQQECTTQACPTGTYCANGCCISEVIE
jgi:hypothetical protein